MLVDAWQACATQPFLAAIDTALASHDTTLDQAWLEFTRWNAFTGGRADRGAYPAAHAWPEVPREPALQATGTVYLEGMSARYVPLELAARSRVELAGGHAAGWLVGEDDKLASGTTPGVVEPGRYLLVVTGLARDTIATPIEITISEPAPEPVPDTGCAAAPGGSAHALLWISWLVGRRRYAISRARLR